MSAGLVTLHLHDASFSQSSPGFPPLFALQRLNLYSSRQIPLSSWLPLLQPSITKLTINRDCLDESELLRDTFRSIGAQLESLHIVNFPAPTTNHIFNICTSVSYLTSTFAADTTAPLRSLLLCFPENTLETLSIYRYRTTAQGVLDVLLDLLTCHTLYKLEYLFCHSDFLLPDVLEVVGSEDILARWKGRGVKVKFYSLILSDCWED